MEYWLEKLVGFRPRKPKEFLLPVAERLVRGGVDTEDELVGIFSFACVACVSSFFYI